MATDVQAVCAVCGEPANKTCTGCKSDTSVRRYCGEACQTKDWPTHKKACKDIQSANLEKKLARVAEIVQQAYYDFRENTWTLRLSKIEDLEHVLTVHDGGMPVNSRYFIDFPHHLVTNDRTKKAMLSALACEDSLAWMHDSLVDLFKGLDVKVDEISITLGHVPRKITIRKPSGADFNNWPGYPHAVIRITAIKSKKPWVIDLSGAQFRIGQSFWDWGEYLKEYRVSSTKSRAFGASNFHYKYVAVLPSNTSPRYGLCELTARHLNEAVSKWKSDRTLSLADLLSMEDEEYKETSLGLLHTINDGVRSYIKNHDFTVEWDAAMLYEREHPGKGSRLVIEATAAWYTAHDSNTTTD